MHVETGSDGDLQDLGDNTEVITEIPLACALLEYEKPKKQVSRTWGITDEPIGDPLVRRAEAILRQNAPYPGDDLGKEETLSSERFLIYRTSETRHLIMDRASHLEDDIEIPSFLLNNPNFFISDWYMKRLAWPLDVPRFMLRYMQQRTPMGDAIAERVATMLNAEVRLPGESSPDRFYCHRVGYENENVYEIFDQELNFYVCADDKFLSNEKLNVNHWYAKHLFKAYRKLNGLMVAKELEWENNHLRLL
ncbi:hypothetical protein C8R48DRAFT_605427, partial [Suillus tomentosus]